MKNLASLEDDLPASAISVVDSRKFYEAFLHAEEILAAAPKQYRDTSEQRLPELISHLYRGGDQALALFRRHDDASQVLTDLWLSSVRRLAGWYIVSNSIPKFTGISPGLLSEAPRRFRDAKDLSGISPWLAEYGVALVYENSLPGMKLDGAIFSTATGHVVIALSLRYPRLDNFWFTLLHELAHAALHADQLQSPILDDLDAGPESLVEQQANRLATDSLIPRNEWRSCPARYSNSVKDITAFADRLSIPPQCVAGRLRRELGRYDLFSEIVNKYNVREILNGDQE